jgi:hypothetical protein
VLLVESQVPDVQDGPTGEAQQGSPLPPHGLGDGVGVGVGGGGVSVGVAVGNENPNRNSDAWIAAHAAPGPAPAVHPSWLNTFIRARTFGGSGGG